MLTLPRVAVFCVAASLGVCRFTPPREIVAPATGRVNVPIDVAVTGSFTSADALEWTAAGGRFTGPTNAPTAKLIPTAAGQVTVVLTVRSTDGSSITYRAALEASGPVGAGAGAVVQPVAAQDRPKPLLIDADGFVPSGFMGDGERGNYVKLDPAHRDRPHSPPAAYRLVYRPGPVGWMAINWQYPPNNWGDLPGKNLQRGFRELSVWARADPDPRTGAFPMVQFKAGGGTDPAKKHQASFESIGDFVTLTADWVRYSVVLGNDLSNVASAVTVVVRAQDVSAAGAVIFFDDFEYR